MTELLKGAPVARALTEELAARCAVLRERGVVPTLAIVRVGEREDDLSYERGALKRCDKVGIEARRVLLPADVSQDELLATIKDINADSAVHGCLMFRPLPAGLDEDAVAAALDPAKDVDSMTPASLLTTLSGRGKGFAPCTAEAVLALLDHYGVELDGAKVAVVGRSLVIGRPVAAMLTARNATVTTCHTHTRVDRWRNYSRAGRRGHCNDGDSRQARDRGGGAWSRAQTWCKSVLRSVAASPDVTPS